jgi:hypothetical protein
MTHEREKLRGAPLRASEKRNRGPTAASFQSRAKTHAEDALEALAALAKNAASEAVRVSAANALLDRAYGKPASGVAKPEKGGDGQRGPIELRWVDPDFP